MNRVKFAALLIGVVALAGLAAYAARRGGRSAPGPKTAPASRGTLEVWFEEIGDLEAKLKVDVKSSVTGSVVKVLAEEGQLVAKGQELAVVQPGRTKSEGFLPTAVLAPMAGAVLRRRVEPGDSVVSGMAEFGAGTVLFTVADLSRMLVRLNVNEADVPRLASGQEAQILLDAFPGEFFSGRIAKIAPAADLNENRVKVFKTEVELAKTDPRLLSGMTARVRVLVARREAALLIPLEALHEEGDGWAAFVRRAGREPAHEKRAVRLGLQGEFSAEILSGLAQGEEVLLEKPKS